MKAWSIWIYFSSGRHTTDYNQHVNSTYATVQWLLGSFSISGDPIILIQHNFYISRCNAFYQERDFNTTVKLLLPIDI